MNIEQFKNKLKICYFGDMDAFNEIVSVYEDIYNRMNRAIDFVDSFEYYIPEDDKEDLKYILKGGNNEK